MPLQIAFVIGKI